MDGYDVWADRFTASLRALGIAVMVVVLGWLVVSLTANFVELMGRGIAVASLIGYAAGRLHAMWQARRARAQKTIRAEEQRPVMRPPQVPFAWSPVPASMSDTEAAPGVENVKAFFEREMAASKESELRRATELTAMQLQQALEIVGAKVGRERVERDGALVDAVLEALATNCRLATR
jgi:hypothetical protein